MTTKQQQPQGKGEMRCEMCFKKLEEEAISIGCHSGEKMSKIQVTTTTAAVKGPSLTVLPRARPPRLDPTAQMGFTAATTSQQQQQQGKGEQEEEHLICKECAEIITEFTRKKKEESVWNVRSVENK